MRTTLLLSLLSAAALCAADAPEVIGRVGGVQVNAAEVRASIAALGSEQEAAVSRDPELLNQVVRSLLVQRLLLREAESKAHDKEPEVAAKLARVREVALTESYLARVSEPPANWPAEEEIKAAYEKARPSIGVPKSWRLAQIFVSAPKEGSTRASGQPPEKLAIVRKLLTEKGADFAGIAAKYSEEPASAGRGGEIGWLAETQIQPGIREKLGGLKINAISDPIRLDDGWHIIRFLDVREPYTPTLEQVRTQLAAKLRGEKARENSQAFVAKLLETNPVAINEIALGQFLSADKKQP